MTRDEITAALRSVDAEGAAYWGGFGDDVFFRRIGEAWSPSESVRHLTKGIRAVRKALSMPRLVLRVLFGRPRRASVTYDELRTRYMGVLEAGGRAGRFAPSAATQHDRSAILGYLAAANSALIAAVSTWRDADLDRHQLPHPLLGKITVREMLLFTIYHQHHHMAVTSRRRAAAGTS
jgi:hypothetical protein